VGLPSDTSCCGTSGTTTEWCGVPRSTRWRSARSDHKQRLGHKIAWQYDVVSGLYVGYGRTRTAKKITAGSRPPIATRGTDTTDCRPVAQDAALLPEILPRYRSASGPWCFYIPWHSKLQTVVITTSKPRLHSPAPSWPVSAAHRTDGRNASRWTDTPSTDLPSLMTGRGQLPEMVHWIRDPERPEMALLRTPEGEWSGELSFDGQVRQKTGVAFSQAGRSRGCRLVFCLSAERSPDRTETRFEKAFRRRARELRLVAGIESLLCRGSANGAQEGALPYGC